MADSVVIYYYSHGNTVIQQKGTVEKDPATAAIGITVDTGGVITFFPWTAVQRVLWA